MAVRIAFLIGSARSFLSGIASIVNMYRRISLFAPSSTRLFSCLLSVTEFAGGFDGLLWLSLGMAVVLVDSEGGGNTGVGGIVTRSWRCGR